MFVAAYITESDRLNEYMSNLSVQTAQLVSLLPEDDLTLVNELVKKLLLAWDPDFTKVTPEERSRLDKADEEMKSGEYFTDDEVWN